MLQMMQTSIGVDVRNNIGFCCYNPCCGGRKNLFESARALSLHLARSPACEQYANERDRKRKARQLTLLNAEIVVDSSKRPTMLRRDVVNDITHIIQNESENEVLKDWSDFNFGDTYGDEMEAYEQDDPTECSSWEGDNISVLSQDTDAFSFVPPPKDHPLMFTSDQKWTIALLKLLDDMNAPDYAFEAIIKWARAAKDDHYSFYPQGGMSRSKNVDILFQSMHNAKQLLPSVQPVPAPNGSPCDVIVFDFVPQLLKLLQNRKIMIQDNLVLDMQHPLQPFHSPNGDIGEALSGSVYRDAYSRFLQHPERELFVPIIQWIDRTSVTGNDRFSLKPYMFTPAIFTETFRRRIEAWGYHGFLPKSRASSAQNQMQPQGENLRNYHAQLRVVLQTFETANARLRNVTLPIGPNGAMTVDVKTCLLFIIQDMQEGDMLCGRYGPHTSKVQRQCRACNVNYEDLDNVTDACRYLYAGPMAQIASCPNDALRQRWSQHALDNTFNHVPLADPIRGIFGATPVETMHAFRKGVIEVVTFLVLDNIPKKQKAALDRLAVRFHKSHRQSYRKAYPATDFSNGITNLTKISAAERLGLVFLFVILAQYDEGWRILNTALKEKTDKELPEIVNMFECLLCFDAWLNRATFWKLDDLPAVKAGYRASIVKQMQMCKTYIPTVKATSWKFPKFHELLHIVDDIERFGAPMNYCAQRPESLLIPVAKQPGRRAQKRQQGVAYELQAAQRLSYSIIIDTMYSRLWDGSATRPGNAKPTLGKPTPNTGRATFATVVRNDHPHVAYSKQISVTWETATDTTSMEPPRALSEFMLRHFGNPVRFCSEFRIGKNIFRCHPSFQSDGAMYDWMKAVFNGKVYPCRLAAVVVLTDSAANNEDRLQLVVQRTTHATGINSVLFTEWRWSREYHVILPSDVKSPCFVVSIKEDTSKILETLPIEEWHQAF
jgi:hypothetical protein